MNEVLTASATRQALLIREGKISPPELIQAHLDHIAKVNLKINAAIEVFAEQALQEARNRRPGPFSGVPFSIKDSIRINGKCCTAGTLGARNLPPAAEDAALIRKLRGAGAIPIARTNLPDLLFAFESDNLLFGATNNPYDLSRTAGGSSGGEAALIATCGSPMGLGSDAAGSVRLPAAFCGIAGLKPTSGQLDREGHFPPAGGWIEALWQIGPMARYVEDLHLMMQCMWQPFPLPGLKGLRVAVYTDNGIARPDLEIAIAIHAAANLLEPWVTSITEDRPQCLAQAYDLEMSLLGPDGGDSLRSYLRDLGSLRLHRLLDAWLNKLEPYRTDLAGFQRTWAAWDQYRAEMRAFLSNYDAILCPAYIHAALPHGTSTLEEKFRGFSHTMAYNVAGLPGAVVRVGEVSGLPIAAQIVAGPGREDIALAIAGFLEQALGGWKPPALISQE